MKALRTYLGMRAACAAVLVIGMAVAATACWGANVTYYSQGSLDPNLLTSWNTVRAGGGSQPANFSSGDAFVIQNGHNMAVTSSQWALYGTSKLWIESGGTLTANYPVTLSSTSTFQIDGGGTYVHNNTATYDGSIFRTGGTRSFAPTSTVVLDNSNTAGPSGVTFGNLTVNLSTMTSSVQCSGGLTTVNGNLTLVSTGTAEFRLSDNTGYTLTIGGDLVLQSATLNLMKSAAGGVSYGIHLGGSFNQSGGTFYSGNATTAATVAFTGGTSNNVGFTSSAGTLSSANINWQVASGKIVTVSGTSSSVTLGGSGRTVALDGTLQIGSTGSPILAGAITVGGTGSIGVDGGGSLYAAGSLTNNGAMTVNGTLRLNSGGSLSGNAPTYGTSSALIYARAGTVGNEWGPGGSAGPGVPQNVQMKLGSLTSTLSLPGDRTVPGQLSFASGGGVVATGSHVLAIGSAFGSGATTGWVNGTLQQRISSTAARTFDIGDGTNYLPVTVAFTSLTAAGDLAVGATAGTHPDLGSCAIDPGKYVKRYWTLTGGGVAGTYTATFTFLAGDIQGSGDSSKFIVGEFAGDWAYPAVGTKTTTSTQATGMTSFGDFAIGEWGRWIIRASATVGGSISPAGSVAVSPGTDQSFSATAGGGYHVVDLVADGVSQGAITSYTFSGVAADHVIRAHFVSDAAPTDLVGWWPMDEGSGAAIGDASDHGNAGALPHGASWVAGRSGTALALDGAAQYAAAPPNTTLAPTTAITLAAWIRPGATRAQNVITKAVAGGSDGYELGLSGESGGHAFFRLEQLSLTPRLDAVASYPADGSTWVHVAATYDGMYMRIYVNGVEDNATTVASTLTIRPNTLPLAIGAQVDASGAASRYFQGAVDDARVYNRALGAVEIRMLAGLTTYEIAASAGTGGSISPSGTVYVVPGSDQTFTIAPAPGYDIADVLADGAPVGAVTTYVFRDVSANHTIAASFTLRNSPPPQPTVVGPPDGANGVSASPTLDVAVSDPDGDHLTVTYYARPADLMLPAPDFSVVVLPDAQNYTGSTNGGSPAILDSQTRWIAGQRAARNIAYVAQVGDLSQHGDSYEAEWQAADGAFRLIEDPATTGLPEGVPYGIAVGNHEQIPYGATTLYNQYFGAPRFAGRSYYGGHYGVNNNNHFDLFSAGGMDFLVLYMEISDSPSAAVLGWADGLLKAYPTRRAVVVYHYLIDPGDPGAWSAQGQAIYDALKGDANLFLMLCGHVTTEGQRTDTYAGRSVSTLLADYQDRDQGGDGWLRVLDFSPTSDEIRVKTYSPWLDAWETDANSQFTLAYDMPATTHAPFTAIGTVTGVASGSTCRLSWPGRDPVTAYEWYATVSDGEFTTVGPTCRFTTGSGVSPQPPANLTATQARTEGGAPAGVALAWDATPAGTGVEIWRAAFGHYPRFAAGGGKVPTAPTAWSDPPPTGWTRLGEVTAPTASLTDDVVARDSYYYVAFVRNGADERSAGSGMTGGTLDYLLGDVSNGESACAGDGVVNTADISLLGMHYGMAVSGDGDPLACLDVGPTTDHAPTSRPDPDGVVEFEDLVIFAVNYTGGTSGGAPPLVAAATGADRDAVALDVPALPAAGGTFDVAVQATGAGDVHALKLELGYDRSVLEMLGAEPGELLARQGAPAVVLRPAPTRVDVALLGSRAGLRGSGSLLKLRFRVLRQGEPGLGLKGVLARDGANRDVTASWSAGTAKPAPPAVTSFAPARPNPFGRTTTLSFALARGGAVELALYGVDGRKTVTLVRGVREAGEYEITWDGRCGNGQAARPGVYYARLSTPQGRFTRMLVLVR